MLTLLIVLTLPLSVASNASRALLRLIYDIGLFVYTFFIVVFGLPRIRRTYFWWKTLCGPLSSIFELAGYSDHLRRVYLSFYISYVIPFIGPAPGEQFKPVSFMSDDHTPVELALVIRDERSMAVQFSFELLSSRDGSPMDPDEQRAALVTLGRCSQVRGFDMTWANICFDKLIVDKTPTPDATSKHATQVFLGGDFTRQGIIVKPYFLPHLRARAEKSSPFDVVTRCVTDMGLSEPWSRISSHFDKMPQATRPVPEIVGVDCLNPASNRFKVYFRTQSSSYNEIADLMTLGGSISHPAVTEALETIRRLWQLLFPGVDLDQPLKPKRRESSPLGFLVYFSMRRGKSEPAPKVYIPVRHYCESDAHVAAALTRYYQESKSGPTAENYMSHVQSIFKHRSFSERTGVHPHIGVSAKSTGPEVSLYFCAEAFSRFKGSEETVPPR